MRHVKISPGRVFDTAALAQLIEAAYADMKHRVEAESPGTGSRGWA